MWTVGLVLKDSLHANDDGAELGNCKSPSGNEVERLDPAVAHGPDAAVGREFPGPSRESGHPDCPQLFAGPVSPGNSELREVGSKALKAHGSAVIGSPQNTEPIARQTLDSCGTQQPGRSPLEIENVPQPSEHNVSPITSGLPQISRENSECAANMRSSYSASARSGGPSALKHFSSDQLRQDRRKTLQGRTGRSTPRKSCASFAPPPGVRARVAGSSRWRPANRSAGESDGAGFSAR